MVMIMSRNYQRLNSLFYYVFYSLILLLILDTVEKSHIAVSVALFLLLFINQDIARYKIFVPAID